MDSGEASETEKWTEDAKIKNDRHVPIEAPTCTVCNRMIKEAGVYFVTLQKEGYVRYSPNEINSLAFKHLLGKA